MKPHNLLSNLPRDLTIYNSQYFAEYIYNQSCKFCVPYNVYVYQKVGNTLTRLYWMNDLHGWTNSIDRWYMYVSVKNEDNVEFAHSGPALGEPVLHPISDNLLFWAELCNDNDETARARFEEFLKTFNNKKPEIITEAPVASSSSNTGPNETFLAIMFVLFIIFVGCVFYTFN